MLGRGLNRKKMRAPQEIKGTLRLIKQSGQTNIYSIKTDSCMQGVRGTLYCELNYDVMFDRFILDKESEGKEGDSCL